MKRLYQHPGDFEGLVRILEPKEGGRTAPVFNGLRWDLRYWHQAEASNWQVWPEFMDDSDDAIPPDRPIAGLVRARFHVIAPELRAFHSQQARTGVGFFCVEGARVYAAGIITRITGLAADLDPPTKA